MWLCLWKTEKTLKKQENSYLDAMKCFLHGMLLVVHMQLYNAEARVPFYSWGNWASERFLFTDNYIGGQKEKHNEL